MWRSSDPFRAAPEDDFELEAKLEAEEYSNVQLRVANKHAARSKNQKIRKEETEGVGGSSSSSAAREVNRQGLAGSPAQSGDDFDSEDWEMRNKAKPSKRRRFGLEDDLEYEGRKLIASSDTDRAEAS